MKKIFSLSFVLIILSACSASNLSQRFLDIRAGYIASDVTLLAKIAADYGDRCSEFELSYTGDGKSGEISVLSPTEIQGVSARIDDKKMVTLQCGDILIDTGIIYGTNVTPVGVLPLIVNALREGYVTSIYTEKIDSDEYMVVEIDETPVGDSKKIIYTLWFAEEDDSLQKAEISADGFVSVTAWFEEVL